MTNAQELNAIADEIDEQRAWVKAQVETLRATEVAKLMRAALRKRSGKDWSVKCGRGTGSGWIDIDSPPSRHEGWSMPQADREELKRLLGVDAVHHQGVSVPSSMAYRRVWLARCAYGSDLGFTAEQYWD